MWCCSRQTTGRVAIPTPTGSSSPTRPLTSTPGSSFTTTAPTAVLPAPRQARGGHAAERHELRVSDRRTGLEWRGTSPRPCSLRGVTSPGRRSCACWPTSPASTGWPWRSWSARPTTTSPSKTSWTCTAGRRGSSSGTWSRWLVDMVGRSVDFHPDPGGHVCPLLRTPRLATPARPAALADHNRRFADLRGRRAPPLHGRAASAWGRRWKRSGASPTEWNW